MICAVKIRRKENLTFWKNQGREEGRAGGSLRTKPSPITPPTTKEVGLLTPICNFAEPELRQVGTCVRWLAGVREQDWHSALCFFCISSPEMGSKIKVQLTTILTVYFDREHVPLEEESS